MSDGVKISEVPEAPEPQESKEVEVNPEKVAEIINSIIEDQLTSHRGQKSNGIVKALATGKTNNKPAAPRTTRSRTGSEPLGVSIVLRNLSNFGSIL